MSFLKKFLSRKLLVIVGTAIVDILVLSGEATMELKDLSVKLITAVGSLYVIVEGIRDTVIAIKGTFISGD